MTSYLVSRAAERMPLVSVVCVLLLTAAFWCETTASPLYRLVDGKRVDVEEAIVTSCYNGADSASQWSVKFDEILVVRLHNADRFFATVERPDEIVLVLDNVSLGAIRAYSIDHAHSVVRFKMSITEFDSDKHRAWSAVFGPLTGKRQSVAVSIAKQGKEPLPSVVDRESYITPAGEIKEGRFGTGYALTVEIIGTVRLCVTIGILLFCLYLMWRLAKAGMLRASAAKTIPIGERPYSLGAVQAFFWFVIVLSSMMFLFVTTGVYIPIPNAVLAIIGIAASTGLLARSVDIQEDKRSRMTAEGAD